MEEISPSRFGKYLMLSKIATGGMAELYMAKMIGDQGFEKLVCIKKILPHLIEEELLISAFIDEAKLAAYLNHENIVRIYDFGSMEGSYFIAMEYLSGKDLRAVMNKAHSVNTAIGLNEALYIGARISSGLDYAHKLTDFHGNPLNIIHRDISPQNIFITYDGQVKIIDFGIAKAAGHNETTHRGLLKGKVAYMSPEQAAGESIDHRSDIYSAGIILYEMLCRKRMFEGDAISVFPRVREGEFEPPEDAAKDLPSELHALLHKALARDVEDRYQSGAEMLKDIESSLIKRAGGSGGHALEVYIKKLFKEESTYEEQAIRNTLRLVESRYEGFIDGGGHTARQTSPMIPDNEDYEKTVVIEEEGYKANRKRRKHVLYLISAAVLCIIIIVPVLFHKDQDVSDKLSTALEALEDEDFSRAIEVFEHVSTEAPWKKDDIASAYSIALRGRAREIMESDRKRAEEMAAKSIRLEPENFRGHLVLGSVYKQDKRYKEALALFRKVPARSPVYPETLMEIGEIHELRQKTREAEKVYSRLVDLAPPFLDKALVRLAMVQRKLGYLDKSVVSLNEAILVNPENESAKRLLKEIQDEM